MWIGKSLSFSIICRLTPQLKELELVHKRFQDEGLVVLGVPSNDFGEQEVRVPECEGAYVSESVKGGGGGGSDNFVNVFCLDFSGFGNKHLFIAAVALCVTPPPKYLYRTDCNWGAELENLPKTNRIYLQ